MVLIQTQCLAEAIQRAKGLVLIETQCLAETIKRPVTALENINRARGRRSDVSNYHFTVESRERHLFL
jgi:hypothetical protein